MYSVLYTLQDIFRGDFKNAFSNEDRLSKVYFALADTLLMMLVFGMIKALFDAFICCWAEKYRRRQQRQRNVDKLLPARRAIHLRSLVVRARDILQAGQVDHHPVATAHPDTH